MALKVLIYTAETTERLCYTFDFILGDLLGLEYVFTRDKEFFLSNTGPKFSYAARPAGDELFFECVPLLFESNIYLQPVDFVNYENMVGFYLVSARSVLPFDMFASAFSLLSRYNEYLIHKKDKYDRYRAGQSPNYTAGFLNKPMVNYYSLKLKKLLAAKYPELNFKENKFQYLATIDVDMAYAYRGRGWRNNMKGFARGILVSNFRDVISRYLVVFQNKRDPFDTFDYILSTCKKYAVKTKFFFLVGNKSGLDKNISHTHDGYREIIKSVSQQSEIGIYLSFMSHISNAAMEEEIQRLEFITGIKITSNRFNYLRFTMPASFISLNRIGITDDYSMGYATRTGFRAGTCSPFYFFNLLKNERTTLKLHPFAFMDTTLARYNKLGTKESLEKILLMMTWVKEVEGTFVGIWHNNSFVNTGIWRGWETVFETVAREASAITEKGE